ncbi:MAG: hypothetical protein PHY34_04725 [Patescibacteria group bacterium]|nr:hypothetical protein [Patescibacteria group bacterium]
MTVEFMVLFGGSLLVLSMRRRTLFAKRHQKGILRMYVLLIEMLTVIIGATIFLAGVITFLR